MISSPLPLKGKGNNLNMEIGKRLPAIQNIHHAKFYVILLVLTNIQQISCNIHIFPHIQQSPMQTPNNVYSTPHKLVPSQ
jgi:hypothetical protein